MEPVTKLTTVKSVIRVEYRLCRTLSRLPSTPPDRPGRTKETVPPFFYLVRRKSMITKLHNREGTVKNAVPTPCLFAVPRTPHRNALPSGQVHLPEHPLKRAFAKTRET
jgi:hypothetical protein